MQTLSKHRDFSAPISLPVTDGVKLPQLAPRPRFVVTFNRAGYKSRASPPLSHKIRGLNSAICYLDDNKKKVLNLRSTPFFTFRNNYFFKIDLPAYSAISPNSSSIRMSWLYLAIRSVRDIEPVLICPQLVATAISAMVVSSVSPER